MGTGTEIFCVSFASCLIQNNRIVSLSLSIFALSGPPHKLPCPICSKQHPETPSRREHQILYAVDKCIKRKISHRKMSSLDIRHEQLLYLPLLASEAYEIRFLCISAEQRNKTDSQSPKCNSHKEDSSK